MLISAVQQSDLVIYLYIYLHIYIYIFFFIFFSIIVYHRILNIVPCAIHKDITQGPCCLFFFVIGV